MAFRPEHRPRRPRAEGSKKNWDKPTSQRKPTATIFVCYRSISDRKAWEEYAKLGVPAVLAAGGRFLARSSPAKIYEAGVDQRTVLIEFDSLSQAITAHDSPGYQAALAALGNAAERDLRIVEGVET
jgi:uncharacterized protein (DUF1330 family)